ncbi:MAG: hypothetical protein OXT65_03150 [Alphaproteobacteria bacterium]|nr:hypothetical protein [Alphaproteobacteria bacterium]
MNYKASWAGLARMTAWTLLFLWLAGYVLPPQTEDIPFDNSVTTSRITPMLTASSDPRRVRSDVKKGGRTIAWVTDSLGAKFPPDKALEDVKTHDVRMIAENVLPLLPDDTHINIYIQANARSLENYISLLSLIQTRPDIIVFSINPVATLSPYVFMTHPESLAAAVPLWAKNGNMLWLATLAQPHHMLRATITPFIPIVRESALRLPQDLSLFQKTESTTASPISATGFWAVAHADKNHETEIDSEKAIFYKTLLARYPEKRGVLPARLFAQSLSAIAQSGIPALVYVPPHDPAFDTNPAFTRGYKAVIADLTAIYMAKGAKNIAFITAMPENVQKNTTYRRNDGFHNEDTRAVSAFLAKKMSTLLNEDKAP